MVIVLLILLVLFVFYLVLIRPNPEAKERTGFLVGRNIARSGVYDNTSDAPENSFPAFKMAIAANYGIETQVRMTSDGVLVTIADKNLLRLLGVSTNIEQMSWQDLTTLRILGTGERLVRLEEILDLVDGVVPLVIEISADENHRVFISTLVNFLKVYRGDYIIESSNKALLMELRQLNPEIPRGLRAAGPAVEGQSIMEGFLGSLLLTNIQTRPDCIFYYFRKGKNMSLVLCKAFYRVTTVGWTLRTMDEYQRVNRIFDGLIFEKIRPASQFVKGKVQSQVQAPPVMAQSAIRKNGEKEG